MWREIISIHIYINFSQRQTGWTKLKPKLRANFYTFAVDTLFSELKEKKKRE